MFAVFSNFADWLTYSVLKLPTEQHFAISLQFFVYNTGKILFLLATMIYLIGLLRAGIRVEGVRDFLGGRSRLLGYGLGSLCGALTPFCSCSSIPLFLGFTTAGIPIGATMAFLITSPLVNEVAVVLLGGLLGWKFVLAWVTAGLAVGIGGGFLLDLLRTERFLKPFVLRGREGNTGVQAPGPEKQRLSLKNRHEFAWKELKEIYSRVWKWVLIGVGFGALIHGFVPENWITSHLGNGQWWSVPAAVVLGLPLYSNATGMVPVMESLLLKGLPVGTTLALAMSAVGASLPEFMLLKQVMQWKLLAILAIVLLTAFMLVGWFFNVFWQGGIL